MAHTQGSLDLLFDLVDDPGRLSRDGLLVVDCEIDFQRFSICWIEVDFLLDETVNLSVVDSELEGVLWMRLVIGPHFCQGRQAAEGNGEREDWVFRVLLLSSDDMFAYC